MTSGTEIIMNASLSADFSEFVSHTPKNEIKTCVHKSYCVFEGKPSLKLLYKTYRATPRNYKESLQRNKFNARYAKDNTSNRYAKNDLRKCATNGSGPDTSTR